MINNYKERDEIIAILATWAQRLSAILVTVSSSGRSALTFGMLGDNLREAEMDLDTQVIQSAGLDFFRSASQEPVVRNLPAPHKMSEEDLTAAANLIKSRVDWSKYRQIAAAFSHVPSSHAAWHELVEFSLFSLEQDENAVLTRDKLIADAIEALQWCSGSSDFGPGGVAHLGWESMVLPVLKRLRTAIGKDY